MKLPNTAHTSRPWRIHELTPDFDVEDVWALATPGRKDELPRLVSLIASGDFPYGAPVLVRTLWEARWKIGALLGWDSNDTGIGSRVNSLRDRLPSDLRAAPTTPRRVQAAKHIQLAYEGASWPLRLLQLVSGYIISSNALNAAVLMDLSPTGVVCQY